MQKSLLKQQGIGLLELMLSIAIISIILISAIRYYMITHLSQQVNDATSMLQNIQSAGQHWLVTHDDYADISLENLQDRNLIPQTYTRNPWGGGIEINSYNNNQQYQVIFHDIPSTACNTLSDRFETQGPLIIDQCAPDENNNADFEVIFQ